MPRPLRQCIPGELYHSTARGNDRQSIFLDDIDYREYLQLLYELTRLYAVKVHLFTLMPNHLHLLLQPADKEGLSKLFQVLQAKYARYINRRYGRVGHLFQGRFHSKHVPQDAYLLVLSRYIHRNPVKAKLVKEAWEYPWSSAKAYVGGLDMSRNLDRLIDRMVVTELILGFFKGGQLGEKIRYREFLASVPDTEVTFKK